MKDKKLVIYVHGKGGNAQEAEHYKALFSNYDIVGLDYKSETPWEAKVEFRKEFHRISADYCSVVLIANSIGAYFCMNALYDKKIEGAFFISPMVNMEKLISDMMSWAGVTEKELEEKGEIPTTFGETLSWKYLEYVRQHPICWNIPTKILYAKGDNLVSLETMTSFAKSQNAELCIMENGEHWFHTEEQMAFLDKWILG